jgi:hypothetical protein
VSMNTKSSRLARRGPAQAGQKGEGDWMRVPQLVVGDRRSSRRLGASAVAILSWWGDSQCLVACLRTHKSQKGFRKKHYWHTGLGRGKL